MTEEERLALRNKYQRDWCRRNPERAREIARQSYERHREERLESRRRYRAGRRQVIVDFKAGGCVRCGFADVRALQLHHRDPAEKEFTISILGPRVAVSRLLAELAKCDVLCANCHAIEHSREG